MQQLELVCDDKEVVIFTLTRKLGDIQQNVAHTKLQALMSDNAQKDHTIQTLSDQTESLTKKLLSLDEVRFMQ